MARAACLGHKITGVQSLPVRPASPDLVQLNLLGRIRSGFGYAAASAGGIAGGVVTGVGYGLLATSPVGWVVGGLVAGAAVTGLTSYVRGSEPQPEPETEPEAEAVPGTAAAGVARPPTNEEQWKEVQADKVQYEARLQTLVDAVGGVATTRLPAVRTLYRRIIDRQPLMLEINGESRESIDSWRGDIPILKVRDALREGQRAIQAYEDFIALIDKLSDSVAVESPTKKALFKSGAFRQLMAARAQDLERRAKAMEEITAELDRVAPILEAQDASEAEIRTARRTQIRTGETAGEAHAAVGADGGGAAWFNTAYPNGWVSLAGNAYAAIMPAAVAALNSAPALTMFQEALQNGTIADYGTGASGVKWGKRELKVRRTRLESIQMAGDTRLTGPIVDIPQAAGGPDRAIRVLQLNAVIQAH
jgi:hypothetical protein